MYIDNKNLCAEYFNCISLSVEKECAARLVEGTFKQVYDARLPTKKFHEFPEKTSEPRVERVLLQYVKRICIHLARFFIRRFLLQDEA